eukprot:COSAG05_NODE_1254_length_5375_cov_10.078658_1_plen_62_part_00
MPRIPIPVLKQIQANIAKLDAASRLIQHESTGPQHRNGRDAVAARTEYQKGDLVMAKFSEE